MHKHSIYMFLILDSDTIFQAKLTPIMPLSTAYS